jgi:hypothetical protein
MGADSLTPAQIEQRGVEAIAQATRKADANPMNPALRNNVANAVSELAQFYASRYPQRVIDAMRTT